MALFGMWWHVLGLLLVVVPAFARESDGVLVGLFRELNDIAEEFDVSPWLVVLCGLCGVISGLSVLSQPPSQTPFPGLVLLVKSLFGVIVELYRLLATFYQFLIVLLLGVSVVVTAFTVFVAFVSDHSSADSSTNERRQSA